MVENTVRITRPKALNLSSSFNRSLKFKTFGLETSLGTPTTDFVRGYRCSSPSDLSVKASPKLPEMPYNPGGIVQKALPAPWLNADGFEPHAGEFAGEVQRCQFLVMALDVDHLQKDHGIVHPILDVGVLEVKCGSIRLEQG